MADADALAAALGDFAGLLSGRPTVSDILHRLADLCCEYVGVDGAGVLLRGGEGRLRFATASDELGRAVEHLEEELGDGPCVYAFEHGVQVAVPDLATAHDRFPEFAPRAVALGIGGIHAAPMVLRGQRLGVLDLITTEPRKLDERELATAQLLSDVAISYVVNSRAFDDTAELADQLQRALDSRIVIEQAKGVLAERHGVDVATAFAGLRAYARSRSTRLHDVALAVVEGRLDPIAP